MSSTTSISPFPKPNPNVMQIQQPWADATALSACVLRLKMGVESLGGYRGLPLDRAVTFNDLIAYGLLSQAAATSGAPPVLASTPVAGGSGAGVTTFNTRAGDVTLTSADVTGALGFTPGPAYTLPTASTSTLGGVKVDGTTITISSGTISAAGGGGTDLYSWAAGVPTLGSFTAVNISGTTSTTSNGTISTTVVDTGANALALAGLSKAVPGSTPYRVALALQPSMLAVNYGAFAWGFSDGTKFEVVAVYPSAAVNYEQWTTDTSRNSNTTFASLSAALQPVIWGGVHDDGTNAILEISMDGANWITVHSVAKSSGFLGSSGYTKVFFGLLTDSSLLTAVSLRCYDTAGLSRVVG